MRGKILFPLILGLTMWSMALAQVEMLGSLLSPNVPISAVPKELKLPDPVLPYLEQEFQKTIGKEGAFDTQFKIVLLMTKVTNVPSKKYEYLERIVMWEVRNPQKTAQKLFVVSPDARVLAIQGIGESSNKIYIETMLNVIERDTATKPRIAAARVLPALGDRELIVPRLVQLLRTKYGLDRGKFSEEDTQRFEDDKVAEAIVISLGEIGDPRAFPALLQIVMSPDSHRDETVKAAWAAMQNLKW
ncbi:HEAT repeat domain-containing protein [Thermospira aquatica]|uniref:HEAT repeat domain-containing protein n=1 Tax=Thermospira aquatica TaxID=2828656 RepID=A0AAX3BFU9_9SPIR|nr:HEAT repeat domain-containing protein [Thermospira aquatica]URA11126.1 HEAT repeat domain-containing protein [Thermospira aquatica]